MKTQHDNDIEMIGKPSTVYGDSSAPPEDERLKEIEECKRFRDEWSQSAIQEEMIAVGWTILTVLAFLHRAPMWAAIPLAIKALSDWLCCASALLAAWRYSVKREKLLREIVKGRTADDAAREGGIAELSNPTDPDSYNTPYLS